MDIYDNPILCKRCNKQMDKIVITKEGYNLRAWRCPECKVMQLHPLDSEKYNEFQRLKQRDFEVKLRMIGNSFCVSIPREIIEFEKEFILFAEKIQKQTGLHFADALHVIIAKQNACDLIISWNKKDFETIEHLINVISPDEGQNLFP